MRCFTTLVIKINERLSEHGPSLSAIWKTQASSQVQDAQYLEITLYPVALEPLARNVECRLVIEAELSDMDISSPFVDAVHGSWFATWNRVFVHPQFSDGFSHWIVFWKRPQVVPMLISCWKHGDRAVTKTTKFIKYCHIYFTSQNCRETFFAHKIGPFQLSYNRALQLLLSKCHACSLFASRGG